MCECLAYEDGTMWLCEACGPRWLEHEHKLSERPAPAPLAAAIEEARKVVAIVDVCRCGCGKGECCAAPYGNALRSLLLALDSDDRLAKERIESALDVLTRYGQTDGAHHKTWVIDQAVRALTGDGYAEHIRKACDGEDGPDTYGWDVGIAP